MGIMAAAAGDRTFVRLVKRRDLGRGDGGLE